jgi:hypothetical protein
MGWRSLTREAKLYLALTTSTFLVGLFALVSTVGLLVASFSLLPPASVGSFVSALPVPFWQACSPSPTSASSLTEVEWFFGTTSSFSG